MVNIYCGIKWDIKQRTLNPVGYVMMNLIGPC